MMKRHLLPLFLLLSTSLSGQLHTPQYFSQYTDGTGWSLYYTDILIGDINLDTVPDVIFTMAEGYQVGFGKMNQGKITFEMQQVDFYQHGWWYFDGQLVDYDRDGDLDFITAASNNFDYTRTYIMENEGGQLVDTFRLASPEYPDKAKLFFGKFNDDDVDDLLIHVTQPLSLALYDGVTGEERSLPFSIFSLSALDLNDDGLFDFHQVMANSPVYHTQTDILYINNGDYSFDRYETPGYLSHPVGQATPPFGDFDGDGVDDQFAKPLGEVGLSFVFKTNMKSENEARFDTLRITTTQFNAAWFVSDITEDGTEDLIVFSADSLYFIETDDNMQLNVYAQAGVWHPTYLRHHPNLPKGTMISMTSGGIPILLHCSYSDSNGLVIEQEYNAFSPYVIYRSIYATPMAATDLDGDGQQEVCVASNFTLAFAELQADNTLAESFIQGAFNDFSARSISAGDWDGDGHDDLFLCEDGRIYVATREPDSTLAERIYLTDGLLFDAHDFDRNGFDDLLIGITDSIFILFNDQGSFVGQEILTYNRSFPDFNVFDPNRDGYPDIALSRDSTLVFMNQGDGTFVESPFSIPGNLARHTLPNSPYLFTILFQKIENTVFYRPNLFRVAPDGLDAQWVTGYVFIDSIINAREAWLVNYDGDSIPDMLFNTLEVGSVEWKALLVNQQEVLYALITVPESFILGAEDVAGDGAAEVLYVRGSKVYLEIGLPQDVTYTEAIIPGDMKVSIYPNPVSANSPWTLAYENEHHGRVMIDLFMPDGRHWRHVETEKPARQFVYQLDAPGIASGTWIIRIADGHGVAVKKLVVLSN